MARLGNKITQAANQQLGFEHPGLPDWTHISFCLFAGPLEQAPDGLSARSAVTIQPGKIDRSPTGTAVSARMAVLHARGQMQQGQSFKARSIIGSRFSGRIAKTPNLGDRPAIIPEISGYARLTGHHH